MAMDRLAAEDQRMLWPDEIWPQDIGALAILDGSHLLEAGGRFRIEAVREVIASRLHLAPRFRQLLYVPRWGLGGPLWADAPAFDLRDHVRVVPLPAPGDEAALLHAVEQLRGRHLDRSRPLWEMCFFPGLAGNQVGMFVRMHHAIADAGAAVVTLGALLDTAPGVPAAPPPAWTPAPPPAARDLLADNLQHLASEVGHTFSALTRPVATARRVRAAWPATRELLARKPWPQTSLDRVVGPGRRVALIRASLDQVRQIARSHDATVNDVLLAVTADGVRGLLRQRGEPIDHLTVPIYVSVTLRPPQARAQARGNLVALMTVALPVGVSDPGARLRQIATQTTRQKAASRPSLGTVFRGRMPRQAVLKTMKLTRINLASANVPGPPQPRYLAGARLLEVFPVLPLMAKTTLGIGALSYAGQFNILAVADHDACPDLEVFTAAAQDGLHALAAATQDTPDPHQQR